MKKFNRKKISNIIFSILLIFTFISCINKTPSNTPTIELQTNSKTIPSENKTDTLPNFKFKSMIRSLFEDSNGNLWIGSDAEGLCKYNGTSFSYFGFHNGLKDSQIRTIQEDQDGNIWLATGYGIYKYDGLIFTAQRAKGKLMPNTFPIKTWEKKPTDLWFNGEIEGGIYRYDGKSLDLLEFPILEPDHESFSIMGTVTGICHGKNNRTWMANYGGVIGYDGESFTYINQRGIAYHVRSILEDSKGNLWIGNNGIGVLLYDGTKTINFTKEKNISDSQGERGGMRSPEGTLNHVFAIEEDRYGNIWFGDRDAGAWCYDGKTLKNYTVKDGLPNNFVRTIYRDKKGELWFGLEEGGLCKFNGKSFDKMF